MPSVVSKLVIAKEIEALNAKRPQERYYREETSSEESKEIVALSTKYQLFSELTNYILVDEVAEDEKPVGLPEMHKVESMSVDKMLNSISGVGVFGFNGTPVIRRSMNTLGSSRRIVRASPVVSESRLDESQLEEKIDLLRESMNESYSSHEDILDESVFLSKKMDAPEESSAKRKTAMDAFGKSIDSLTLKSM